jgi:hypothetical protein
MGNIVWLTSYPKSGNTWVRMFLLNLFAGGETPVRLDKVSAMSTSDTVMRWYREIDKRPPETWSQHDVARLRPKVQEHLAGLMPDTMFVKTHAALLAMLGEPAFNMTVTSGAVYIVRNPLDIVVSYAKHAGIDHDGIIKLMSTPNHMLPRTEGLVEFVQGGWSQHVASWTGRPSERIHIVRYEDMLEAPEATFGGICDFLTLPTTPERLARAIAHADIQVLRHLEDETGFHERTQNQDRFFGPGTSGGWRDVLNDRQVSRVVERHRTQMSRFGYVPEGF